MGCDDSNNVAGCSWDGGDCCGPKANIKYCKECACKDCTSKYVKKCPGKAKGCILPNFKGDKNCDDENNNCRCDWDGGDCCAKTAGGSVNMKYCKACQCLDPENLSDSNCKGGCKLAAYQGDGNCDDENNNCGCKWDGGDCCKKTVKGGSVSTKYCKQCKCLDPKGVHLVDAPGGVAQRSTKETATATTRTTTAAAITTVAIAVKQQSKVEKLGQNSANNANAWTLRISLMRTVTKAKINVVRLNTKAIATVTTKTTTVVANTTAVIAALRMSSKNTANNASVLIPPRPTNVTQPKINVVRLNTKAMATVTTKTTTVVANTTAVIAARKHSRRLLAKNSAKSASAWIRRANKLCFFDT